MRQQSQPGMSGGVAAGGPNEETLAQQIRRNWVTNAMCYDYAKRSARDVDTSYARAISHYGFLTRGETKRLSVRDEFNLHAAGYLHQATPGALYRLEQVVHSPDVANGRRQYKLRLDVARDGSGTRVTGQYCVTTDDPVGWRDLPDQVLASLNNTF